MIGIKSIAGYLPSGRIDNFAQMKKFSIEESFVKLKLGMRHLSVKEKSQDTSDLCCKAFESLANSITINLSDIDCMIVCTQNPDVKGLPQTSAIIHHKLNLPQSCATFDISLGCSGYIYSLSIIQSFMSANSLKNGLLFTCDPYSKIIDQNDKSTAMLFGDAATVTLVGENPVWKIGKAVFGTEGENWQAIHVGPEGRLHMQGRDVFNFAATKIPANIKKTLQLNSLNMESIELFAMHQGSKFIIDVLKKRMGIPDKKMPFVAANYGNTVSSSIPLILQNVDSNVKRILACGFGVGLSWGSIVLQRMT